MFCTNCGTKVNPGLKFCTNCGGALSPDALDAKVVPSAAVSHEGAQVEERAVTKPATTSTSIAPVPSTASSLPDGHVPFPASSAATPPAPIVASSPATPSAPPPVERTTLREESVGPSFVAPESPRRSSPALWMLVVLALVAGAAGAYWFTSSSGRVEEDASVASEFAAGAQTTPAVATGQPVEAPAMPPEAESAASTSASIGDSASGEREGRLAVVGSLSEVLAAADPARVDSFIGEIESLAPATPGNRAEARRLNEAGLAALRATRIDEAVSLFESAVAADPSDPEVAGNFADSLMRAGRWSEALRAAEASLALGPTRPSAWGSLGLIYAKLDRGELAVASLVTSHRLSKDPARTERVFANLAANDDDPKVRMAMQEVLQRIGGAR